MKKLTAIIAAFSLTLGGVLIGGPAQADQSDQVIQIINRLAPGLLAQTSRDELLTLSKQTSDNLKQGVQLYSLARDKKSSVKMTVPFAKNIVKGAEGISVLSGDEAAINAVSQSTPNGFRVLMTLTAAPKSNRFDFKFDLPSGMDTQPSPNGFLVSSGSRVLGSVAKPWAIDGNGRLLKTHFEWKDETLTQVLDENLETVSYPVVLDPAWAYIQQYDLDFSPVTSFNRLKTCFNCYFPVDGAPRNYPTQGQLLPLTVGGIGNFECTMGPTFTGSNYRVFEFFATRNHVDGYGSKIAFEFLLVGGKSKLVVEGFVVNNFYLFGQYFYVLSAGYTWQRFANNLNSPAPRT